ncbi:hypothetical protein WJU23_08410 [Prosthecobacter sp. SYSU 5D2]|uniref:hypothetical protein n=1 Tax=Prosthecobacter sp. SYSU 5D2 TaxID=3134134 RepID=UPI0031FEBA61
MFRLMALLAFLSPCIAQAEDLLGQAPHQYRVVPGWAAKALIAAPIKNGHGLALDAQGRLFVLTDNPQNNILILDPETGALINQWTARMPGAHGLALVKEGDAEVLFITDTVLHEVRKLSLDGKELARFPWPEKSGLYAKESEYRPSKTLHHPNGDFWVLDGYGKDYVHHYDQEGSLLKSWGGNLGEGENQLLHWGPHGGTLDLRDAAQPLFLIAMSDRLEIKRFTLNGQFVDKIPFPGGNPRDVVLWGDLALIPHLGDQWPQDKDSPGFISIVDRQFRVLSNIGAPPALYEQGVLQPMKSDGRTFIHPHAVAVDAVGNVFVAQFASKAAPLVKLEPVTR